MSELQSVAELDTQEHPVLPFYFVCDESENISELSLSYLNEVVRSLFVGIAGDPVIDSRIRMCVLGFSDQVNCLVSLGQLSDLPTYPGFVRGGLGDFGQVFTELRTLISRDVPALKVQGFRVIRPIILFVAASTPDDNSWEEELGVLIAVDFSFRPNIVSLGLPGCNPQNVKSIATPIAGTDEKLAYLIDDISGPAGNGEEIGRWFLNTVFWGNRSIPESSAMLKPIGPI
jgi:uncharacterized protein YegL